MIAQPGQIWRYRFELEWPDGTTRTVDHIVREVLDEVGLLALAQHVAAENGLTEGRIWRLEP